jgi:hypothetical protein
MRKAFLALHSGWVSDDAPPLGGLDTGARRFFRDLGSVSCRVCEWHERNLCWIAVALVLAAVGTAHLFGW